MDKMTKENARHLISPLKDKELAMHPQTAKLLYEIVELPLPEHLTL